MVASVVGESNSLFRAKLSVREQVHKAARLAEDWCVRSDLLKLNDMPVQLDGYRAYVARNFPVGAEEDVDENTPDNEDDREEFDFEGGGEWTLKYDNTEDQVEGVAIPFVTKKQAIEEGFTWCEETKLDVNGKEMSIGVSGVKCEYPGCGNCAVFIKELKRDGKMRHLWPCCHACEKSTTPLCFLERLRRKEETDTFQTEEYEKRRRNVVDASGKRVRRLKSGDLQAFIGDCTNAKDIQEHYNPGLAQRIDEAKLAVPVLQKQLRTMRKQKTSADNAVLETYAKMAARKAEIAAWDYEEKAQNDQMRKRLKR
jgi:hypothetical protein